MIFNDPKQVEQVCYDIRLADYPRSLNRTRINNLFNGAPPFDEDQAKENGININVNPLGGTVMAHQARAQFYGAFLRPEKFFDVQTDYGAKHKRGDYSRIITQEVNRKMKRSMGYFETFRSKFAMDVLHGIGPSAWRNKTKWAPDAIGIEDIGIPSGTLLTMENLPFFYVYRSFTLPELIKLTNRANVEKGWNTDLVDKCIAWADKETKALMGSQWAEVWSPEKTAERIKGDGAFYAADSVPTINCFDFYFWSDVKGHEGWNRRMILDAWSAPGVAAVGGSPEMSIDPKKEFGRGQFLFNPGDRVYADKLSNLLSFQFADLSAVAPFKYHSVRSLGYLVYGVCHLQNRLFCRFNESAFEASMQYFRVNSPDDADRALKIDLINRGVIDKSIEFVKQQDRWQVNSNLIESAMNENRRIVDSNASSYTTETGTNNPSDRKTKFQVMAEISQTSALVQSAFNQAYRYQEGEYCEIFRRFCVQDSDDIDVREFRAACLRKGVPEKVLNSDCFDIKPTQTMGGGNKTMEMAITEQLLSMRNQFDPDPQREILREAVFNITDDAAKAARWVPDDAVKVTDTVHDAQLATGTLMQGLPVSLKTGMNHKEYVVTMIGNMTMLVSGIEKGGGMATEQQIIGLGNVAKNAGEHLKIVAQDQNEKAFVAQAGTAISKQMNMVRAFAQRLQEQKQKQQQQSGVDPEAQIRMQAEHAAVQQRLQAKNAEAAQKIKNNEALFRQKQEQERIAFEAEQHRLNSLALHEFGRSQAENHTSE